MAPDLSHGPAWLELLQMREIKRINDEKLSKYTMGEQFLGQGDRYLLMSLLGKGGFSEVFKVRARPAPPSLSLQLACPTASAASTPCALCPCSDYC